MLGDLATYLRALELYYHNCHNLVKGAVFNQDHETFASFYDQCGADYDAVIERAINLEGEEVANVVEQLQHVAAILKDKPCCGVSANKDYFTAGLECEKHLCRMVDHIVKSGCSVGTEQAVGNVADRSEIRQYLIAQRIK